MNLHELERGKKPEKKSHKSQSLETGNKRAYTNNREPHRPHPANQYRRFCLDLAINTICKQFEIPCSNHLMATRRFDVAAAPLQCPTQISIFNWLILMHTRRTVNDAQVARVGSRGKKNNWNRGIRWSMEHAAATQRTFRIVNIDVWIEYLWECECGRPRDLNITFFVFICMFNFFRFSDCEIRFPEPPHSITYFFPAPYSPARCEHSVFF